MTRIRRPLIVLAIVAIALQALVIGARRGGDGGTADPPALFESLGSVLVRRTALDPRAVTQSQS